MLERRVNLEVKMSGLEKAEISFLKNNFAKLKTIADFLDISLEEVTNTCLYPGLYKFWLPIAKIIDEFPDWDLDSGEDLEKLYSLKQKYIKEVHTAYKINQELETLEKKFNNTHSKKHFSSDSEHYRAFIGYVETQVKEEKPPPSTQVQKIVQKVIPIEGKGVIQTKLVTPVISKKAKMRRYLQISLKTGIFILSFIAPILLLVIILERFFYWNYLILLQYQPVLFFLLVFAMILVGIISGWMSILLTRYYLKSKKERYEYERLKEIFNKEIPFDEFVENTGTPTQWYNKFEKFLESKKKDKN